MKVKRLLVVFLSVIMLFGCFSVTEASTTNWRTAYASVLSKSNKTAFALVYIDGDSIPELVAFERPYAWAEYDIYTYKNGKAVKVATVCNQGDDNSLCYVPRKNIIKTSYARMFWGGTYYYQMYGGKTLKNLAMYTYDHSTYKYVVNGKSVKASTYKATAAAYNKKGFVKVKYSNCFANNSTNRNRLKTSPTRFILYKNR